MKQLKGIGTSGLGWGKAHLLTPHKDDKAYTSASTQEEELQRAQEAVDKTIAALTQLAKDEPIFEAHLEMVQDPMIWEALQGHISDDGMNALEATKASAEEITALFQEIDDEYLRARADDVKDVFLRIQENLVGESSTDAYANIPAQSIIVAEELFPSDTARIDFTRIAGIITEKGSQTSHVCIMANNKGIPALVGVVNALKEIHKGNQLLLDADEGTITINPDETLLKVFAERVAKQKESHSTIIYETAATQNGIQVPVMANAGSVDDVKQALQMGADGIGLFRSEFLYMGSCELPDEETQYAAYKEAIRACQGKPITIRTLDIGGDKSLPYMNLPKEENPFLGYRAIRISLAQTALFKTQIRAILRAGTEGDAKIMFPFITTTAELIQAKKLVEECKAELQRENKPFKADTELGIMIETPASVFMAAELAQEADFFSIGSNDLTQYIMVADRGNSAVSDYYDAFNPAVLKAIGQVCQAAHEANIPVSVCGEMASQPNGPTTLLALGVDKLSVNASVITKTKQSIISF